MLCIVSDTHDNEEAIARAVPLIKAYEPGLVLHCGDIVSPDTLRLFAGLPMKMILGNNETDTIGLNRESKRLGFGPLEDELELSISDRRFYLYHGTRESIIDEMAGAQLYDYVLHGHTHVIRDERLGRTRIINPGALFRARRYTFAVLDPVSDHLEFVEVPRGE